MKQKNIIFKNAQSVKANGKIKTPVSVLIKDGYIHDIQKTQNTHPNAENVQIIDCNNATLAPGLIDTNVITGEPGNEYRETIKSAAIAAANGGVTTIILNPNTNPIIDDAALVDFIQRRARDTAIINAIPTAAMTRNLDGTQMTEIGLLKQAGAIAISDGGNTITNAALLKRIMTYAKNFNMPIIQFPQDPSLAENGVMHEGAESTLLGLTGIPKDAEIIMLERDIQIAHATGAQYHASQISCAESVEIIRRAKQKNHAISCSVSINNLMLSEKNIGQYRTFLKLNPPLRTEADQNALIDAVKDGTIDAVISAHNPQNADTKRLPFAEAAFGAVGVETLIHAALKLFKQKKLSLNNIFSAISENPARLLNLKTGKLNQKKPADLIVFDPHAPYHVTPENLNSLSKNTPYEGETLYGNIIYTMCKGNIIIENKNGIKSGALC